MRRLLALGLFALPGVASASFHVMQIEQVIGGVNGDPTQQAIQLRMRTGFQNFVAQAKIVVVDANRMNPITVIDINGNVTHNVLGDRVLIASPNYIAEQGVTADFTLTSLIPKSYFDGGQLIFESDGGAAYWLLCWGNYSGSTIGEPTHTNDADGNFGPCAGTTLPYVGLQALQFTGAASALSTTNLADYALTTGAAVFTNNAGVSDTAEPSLFSNDFE